MKSLQLLLGVLALVVVSCSAEADDRLPGTWRFASGETDGASTAVYGTLKLEVSGQYEDSHRIGGILTYSKGTYAVSGDTLKLTPDAGKGRPMSYTLHFGTHQDKTGKTFTALTLKGSTGLSFLLTKEP